MCMPAIISGISRVLLPIDFKDGEKYEVFTFVTEVPFLPCNLSSERGEK